MIKAINDISSGQLPTGKTTILEESVGVVLVNLRKGNLGKIETSSSPYCPTGGILILCRRTGEKIHRKNENCKKDLLSNTR